MPATVPVGDAVVAQRAPGRHRYAAARTSTERGPWIGDEAGRERLVVEHGPRTVEPLGQRIGHDLRIRRVGDDHEPVLGEPVDDQVVEDAAVGRADHRVVGAADRERRRVRHERAAQAPRRRRHPRRAARPCATGRTGPTRSRTRAMLLEDRAVLHRHPPAGEVDHARAQRLVAAGEWCLVDDGAGPLRVGHEARSVRGVAETVGRLSDERRARSRRSARSGASVEVDPADLVELVVVACEVAADGFHHEVVDGLVDPRAGLDERVLDASRAAR